MTPELSAVIVYYREPDLILPAVRSVHASAGSIAHEVLVVENGGPEPVPEQLHREGDWLRVIRVPTNAGYGAGCNRGFEASSGRHLLFLNPDIEVRADAIPRLVDCLQKHPEVGAASCRIVNEREEVVPHLFEFPSPWWSAVYALTALPARFRPIRRWLGRWLIRYHDPFLSRAADWMIGCAVMVRREALEAVGGWNEGYFLYAEEIDLFYRLRQAGWVAYYVADAEIVHYGGRSSPAGAELSFLQSYVSRYKFIERHLGCGRARAFRWATAVKQLFASGADSLCWVLGAGGRDRRLRSLRTRMKLVRLSLRGSA